MTDANDRHFRIKVRIGRGGPLHTYGQLSRAAADEIIERYTRIYPASALRIYLDDRSRNTRTILHAGERITLPLIPR